ncbi:MAG: hypothetical protein RLZZ399_1183 [Verrucomicrobiota bacterium]
MNSVSPPPARPGCPTLSIHPDRSSLGKAAAAHVVALLSGILHRAGSARVIFACAPSQDDFLDALITLSEPTLDWRKITVFHMDEYVGLSATHPASFRHYLQKRLLSRIKVGQFHPIHGECPDPEAECRRYGALIDVAPIDLICLGIGENGHLAFNDPPVANFSDRASVKPVELDPVCRQQQVHDGCFSSLEEVPKRALTLTLPVFQKATHLSVVVPGARKADAVFATGCGPVHTDCPASLLRTRADATLFLDADSAAKLAR